LGISLEKLNKENSDIQKNDYRFLLGMSMMAFRAFASFKALVTCAELSPETILSALVFERPRETIFETSAI